MTERNYCHEQFKQVVIYNAESGLFTYCEMGSEFLCISELYKSKSSVVFLKKMLICHPKSGIYVILLTQLSQGYLQNFHPKNPPSVIQLFFHIAALQTQNQPKRSESFLSCLPKHQSLSRPSSFWKKAQWSLPGGFRTKYFMVPSVAINVLPLPTPLHLVFLLFFSCFRRNQLLRLQLKFGLKVQLVSSSRQADRQTDRVTVLLTD
jgi:hypothetical protein